IRRVASSGSNRTAIELAVEPGEAGAERTVLVSDTGVNIPGVLRVGGGERVALAPVAIRTGEAPAHVADFRASIPGHQPFGGGGSRRPASTGSRNGSTPSPEFVVMVATAGPDILGQAGVVVGAVRSERVRIHVSQEAALATVGFIRQVA